MKQRVRAKTITSRMLAAAAALAVGAGSAWAADLPPVVKDGKIAYVMTHRLWTVMSNPEKTECPNGMNLGPREQFHKLFPDDGKQRTVVETYLMREADQWLPRKDSLDPFTFFEAQGPVVHGMNLDGKVKKGDFRDEDGEKGVDNQMYRVVGCIVNFRGPSINPIWWYENEYVRRYVANRFMIEISGVDSLENDDDVTVKSYRGMDDLLIDAVGDATGQVITPGGTQRVDERWGKFAQATWKGKIVNGTLVTDPSDAVMPIFGRYLTTATLPINGMRFKLKLTPERANGVIAGYTDIEGFERYINASWPQHYHSNGEMPTISMFHAIERLADGNPDPKTGKMTAISSALDVRFTQIYIVHPNERPLASLNDRQQAAATRTTAP
jgi:hypothetical protein